MTLIEMFCFVSYLITVCWSSIIEELYVCVCKKTKQWDYWNVQVFWHTHEIYTSL